MRDMKKTLILILAFALVIALCAGCGGGNSGTPKETAPAKNVNRNASRTRPYFFAP